MSWRKVAHYYYSGGKELVIHAKNAAYRIRQPDGSFPESPVTGEKSPHPYESGEFRSVPEYGELGLYYGYKMDDTEWVRV